MTKETGMFLYPWDIGEDFESFCGEYAATGCNSIAPAVSYHHGNMLRPSRAGVYSVNEAAISFNPNPALYGELKPDVNPCAESGIVEKLRDFCGGTGRKFSAWTVLLHNSTIGARHPECTCKNAFGDRYAHALCPSSPKVAEYSLSLISDICARLAPDNIILESATMPPALHGTHHEISNLRVTPAIKWLLSFCFCPDCMGKASVISGLDAEKARKTCTVLLDRLLNSETWYPENGDAQINSILLEYPELYAYQKLRQHIVAGFVGDITACARSGGAKAYLIPSATPFEINSAFFEGMSFAAASGAADMLLPLIYGAGEDFGGVKANIRTLDPVTPVGMALTLNPLRYRDKSSFLSAVSNGAEHSAECAYFYNFSIATRTRLSWVREANRILSDGLA